MGIRNHRIAGRGRSTALIIIAAALAHPGAAPAQPVSQQLFGANLWDGNAQGNNADRAWGHARAARMRLVRIGGIMYNNNTATPQTYARWIDSIRAAGAEPLVQVSTIEPATDAAALVSELNIKRKYGVRFWSIGNEPTCGKAAGAAVVADLAGKIKARAAAMKAVDPSIRIFIGEECYWREELYAPLVGGDQDVTGKDEAGRWFADGVAFHNYPFPGADQNAKYTREQVLDKGVPGIRGMLAACKAQAAKADAKHGRAGSQALACALTEFNITYWNPPANALAGVGSRSFLNGHFFAEVYGAAMEYGTFAVLPWSMMQNGGDGTGEDLGLLDGTGALAARPSYHHLSLMSRHMRGNFLPSKHNAPRVKSFATRDGDTVAILILNENASEGGRVAIRLADLAPAADAPWQVRVPVTGEGAAGWDGEISDSLPPESTLLIKALKGGAVFFRATYSLAMANRGESPLEKAVPVRVGRGNRPVTARDFISQRGRFLEGGLERAEPHRVELRTLSGILVAWTSGTGQGWRIDAGPLPPSAYLLTVRTVAGAETRLLALTGR